ncbi:MAG: Ppx/GppA phosphatase family protein [Pseudomonadota bacterium]
MDTGRETPRTAYLGRPSELPGEGDPQAEPAPGETAPGGAAPSETSPNGAAPAEGAKRSPKGRRAKSPNPAARSAQSSRGAGPYAALDLGTNNCRLLVAAPSKDGFRVVDAFSRIVRLGEGVAAAGALSDAAMDRAVEALKICAQKMARRGVVRQRCIATQACRSAANGEAFLTRVRRETGIEFEVISTKEEARLAAAGCRDLIDPCVDGAIVFDIGGGSTELSFLTKNSGEGESRFDLAAWMSAPNGVVTLSERWGGAEVSRETYDRIVAAMADELRALGPPEAFARIFAEGRGHLLGTSGTVTSLAGVHLGLSCYRRDAVDGLWLTADEARDVSEKLRAMGLKRRAAEPCIGPDRADLVVCGCAIFEAILQLWPSERIRVADRGLREGILIGLMEEDRQAAKKRKRAAARSRRRAAARRRKGKKAAVDSGV